MIISPENELIFIKTNKTAGTSVEIWLSQVCEENAVITEIGSKGEEIRQERGYRGPQNYEIPRSRYTAGDWLRWIAKGASPIPLRNHDSIRRVKRYFPKYHDEFFSFCIVRNPWDKAVSHYYWILHIHDLSPSDLSFTAHLALNWEPLPSWDSYTNSDDEVIVDYFVRFENLKEDLRKMCDYANLPFTQMDPLPHAKSGYRKSDVSYREFMTTQHRDRISDICQKEIDYFGYSF